MLLDCTYLVDIQVCKYISVMFFTFSCRMGKRKLRFNARKNNERNKYMERELLVSIPLSLVTLPCELVVSLPLSAYTPSDASTLHSSPCELVVSLPLSAYTSSILPDASTLHSRLILSQQLPLGWTASSVGSSSASHSASLALYKLQISPSLPSVDYSFMLTVAPDCNWTLCLGRKQISKDQCQLLVGFKEKLCTVAALVQVLSTLDESKCCVGNPDTKFLQLAARTFRDKSGKYHYTYVHVVNCM